MRTRDLFAGCSVSIAPHDDVWLVAIVIDALQTIALWTYQDLPEAMETAHDWLMMLADDEAIGPHAARAVHLIREVMA